ncbi:GntR family transcriptional regulator [Pseudomonas sp. BN414]|uniref:FadR/GntR family transcriptional regulator n=1 Tax=Pseudomonas sp. BN414 TaxID=2567888 RepID=UPI002458BAC4|nr:GntR family transcriptional regulator [Pseudomonas sp. BN414]
MKLAERIARVIEDRIVVEAWPVGFSLGREADLAAAADVSRWSFREAVVLLEQMGMVESRRGRNGGLFVASTLFDAVRNGLSNYLEFLGSTPSEIRAVRKALESVMINQAAARMDDVTRIRLHRSVQAIGDQFSSEMLAATADVRRTLLDLAGNSALSLFVHAIGQALIHASWYSSLDDETFRGLMGAMARSTRKTAEALIDGNWEQALAWEDEFLEHFEDVFRHSAVTGGVSSREGAVERADQLFPAGRPPKKAEQIARKLRQQILESDWPIGMLLGSEAELMERFDVGRAVIREAIRSLERLGVVEMGRGGASGLRVVRPDPAQMILASTRYLRRTGLSVEEAACVRTALESIPHTNSDHARRHLGSNPLAETFVKILSEL